MATASPGGSVYSTPHRRRGRRRQATLPFHYVDRNGRWATVAMFVVTVLLALAIGGEWWQTAVTVTSPLSDTQVQNAVVDFYLGGAVSCHTYMWAPNDSPCLSVAPRQGGLAGAVSAGMNELLFGLVGASAVAAVLALLGGLGIRRSRAQLQVEIALVVVVALATVGFAGGSAILGPSPQGSGYCWLLSGNVTNCPAFWGATSSGLISGACDTCFAELSWGGGAAFYEMLVAALLSTVTGIVLWIDRKHPYTAQEMADWAVKNAPVSLQHRPGTSPDGTPAGPTPFPPRPPISATVPGFATPTTDWTCPRCHTFNSRFALQCGRCHLDRPGE